MSSKKEILVYADWAGMESPKLMGTLTASPLRGKEVFTFEYNAGWLKSGFNVMLDPDLQFYPGRYYPRHDKQNFGIFLDSSPDRWGRILMERREAILARKEKRKEIKLMPSDYLLGVYDGHRMGALRFKWKEDGNFLNDDHVMAVPPWTSLRELEHASRKFEEDNSGDANDLKWINILIAPGSSLGGARPKASVLDPKNNLWIAKFPSVTDTKDVGGWELVTNKIAQLAGLDAAKGDAVRLSSRHHTFLTKRFDRDKKGRRIHFASAMTMLGYVDGDNHIDGVSYLQLAEFLFRHGANANRDLEELWRRIVFNILVKNTDDHLRNHGFLLSDKGWNLSPAYDMNPNEHGAGLSLNITETDHALDTDVALSASEFFRVRNATAKRILKKVHEAVKQWRKIAMEIGISRAEQERMSAAFE